MITRWKPGATLSIPPAIYERYEIRYPRNLVIAGETTQAAEQNHISDLFSTTLRFVEMSHSVVGGSGIQVLTLEYGRGKSRIRKEHPTRLASGEGLKEYTGASACATPTEAMFVGPRLFTGRLSPESALWIGRALASPHINELYYFGMDPKIEGLRDDPKFVPISDPFDCIRATRRDGTGDTWGLTAALAMHDISIEEVVT